jgi:hypothetical protein
MLLTATPFNNRPDDIYAMLKLFQIPTKSTLKTVDNLGAKFKDLIILTSNFGKTNARGRKLMQRFQMRLDVLLTRFDLLSVHLSFAVRV